MAYRFAVELGCDLASGRVGRLIMALLIAAIAVTLLWVLPPAFIVSQEDPSRLTSRGWILERRGAAGDYDMALRLFRQAAKEGNAPAMTDLAEMYEKGEGTPRDYATAATWYLKAWDHSGEKWAAYRLSHFYKEGLGVERNQAVANFWNTLASGPACD
jgi:TPR repeat protein